MKLVEAEMLLRAAKEQCDCMEPAGQGPLHKRCSELRDKHNKPASELSADEWQHLQALASPRLLTVWFNSWQYLNEEQVWSGLVVEVTQRLEEKLGSKQRRLMRHWWVASPWAWLRLLLTPMRLLAVVAAATNCKQISDTLVEGRAHLRFKDHSDKIGYQHAVIKDLKLLCQLLGSSLMPFRPKPATHNSTVTAAVEASNSIAVGRTSQMQQAASFLKLCCCTRQLESKERLQAQLLQAAPEGVESSEPRIVVFIDDLDRCKPNKIIEVLEAINLVLAGSGFAVVVGMDKEFIVSAIQRAYSDVEVMKDEEKAAEFLKKVVQAGTI
ncbi:hypothetical protein OEZ86_013307 [Tetradesmus obliquus]|nr:hypothetical protein OEZ86_013307 [Tetradesmus obliquus]